MVAGVADMCLFGIGIRLIGVRFGVRRFVGIFGMGIGCKFTLRGWGYGARREVLLDVGS